MQKYLRLPPEINNNWRLSHFWKVTQKLTKSVDVARMLWRGNFLCELNSEKRGTA